VDAIADAACKQELARRFAAQAVDMEAAAVAEVAREHGLEFRAVKAISEDAGFPLPPLGRFLREDGGFYTLAFVAHVLARPRLWRAVGELRRNTGLAAAALRGGLRPVEAGWAPLGETRQRRGGAG
jgi:adenosylhomocysteine nucleosidase